MSEMIERVARAICEASHHKWPEADGYNERAEKRAMMSMAVAALKAMREPSEAMVIIAMGKPHQRTWQAMIDAALSPPVPEQQE